MPETTSCTPCCATTQTTNVPGLQGDPGSNGTNGLNAFSVTTADFTVPAVGSNVTVTVDQSVWFAIGQNVVADGPANFTVVSTPTVSSVTLKFLGYTGDVSPGATVSSGANISPAGVQGVLSAPLKVYASGTAYSLTATAALLDFGTTDPTLVLTAAGTYLILSRVRFDYTGATFAAVRTVTTKLRRTNNTATDLTNGSSSWKTDIITTLTYTAVIQELPPVIYTTSATDDSISLYGSVSVVPTAGSLDAVEAEIVAIKLY